MLIYNIYQNEKKKKKKIDVSKKRENDKHKYHLLTTWEQKKKTYIFRPVEAKLKLMQTVNTENAQRKGKTK